MELDKYLSFKVGKLSCLFRTINSSDVTQSYVDGLVEETKYIENIPENINISNQKKYIDNTINSKYQTICGLFLDKVLVGTAGIQLSLSESFSRHADLKLNKIATIGIFIISKTYRGMGLGKTLVWASTYLFNKCTSREWFGAGMQKENVQSYKSFISCGYKAFESEIDLNDYVLINITDLIKPEIINRVTLY